MYHLLLYELADDYLERRPAYRAEHLALAGQLHERGVLRLGGAFADPADGAALVFEADDAGVVEDFVRRDPYVVHGLVKSWRVREWTVVVGG